MLPHCAQMRSPARVEAQRPILLVDDDEDVRETIADVLQGQGYLTIVAANGKEALELIARRGPPSLILLDMMMPEMDGWEFRRQQAAHPELASVPVVVFSAGGKFPEDVPVLTKPVTMEDLLAVVARAAGGA
jgi:CheY-like chemotaxis protein